MKKRLLSILLVLIMALSVLPTAAFAEDGGENLPACICETACTAEEMNIDCPVCGAEGAQPENCALYAQAPDADDPAPEDEDDEAFEEDGTSEDGEASALAPQLAEGGAAVQAAHTHCFCGGGVNAGDHSDHTNVVTYKPCTKANYLRQVFWIEKVDVAYVYLEDDITLDYNLSIQEGKTLYLCLNGHTLNLGQYFIWVGREGATLYLCDCSAQKTGTVLGGSNCCVSVDDASDYKATFNMYSGTLRGGNRTGFGGGVEIVNGTMNMYGGTITENRFTNQYSGAVVLNNGTMNMTDGCITANTAAADNASAGVLVKEGSVFTMDGGTISDGTGTRGAGVLVGLPGGVYNESTAARFVMNDGTISGNTANATHQLAYEAAEVIRLDVDNLVAVIGGHVHHERRHHHRKPCGRQRHGRRRCDCE